MTDVAALLASLPRPELSAKTGMSGNRIDRHGDRRDDAAFLEAQEEKARFLLFDGAALVEGDHGPNGGPEAMYHTRLRDDVDGQTRVYCGEDGDGPVYAYALRSGDSSADVGGLATTPPMQQPLRPFVEAFAPLDHHLGLLAEGASLTGWHRRHMFCAKCGGTTHNEQAGWRRRCDACDTMHFPRTDPVVIMNVIDPATGDILLGRQTQFVAGRFSCLAGFVESGETLEDAVRREVLEEAGIPLGRVTYKASQPWPFPSTLMMGFEGEALARDITIDEAELAEARWFTKDEVRQIAGNPDVEGLPSLPPKIAIARTLLDDYLGL
ncbi:MAG: NAD(+) diphosphatase [Devosiaceae bacterium]